jgi:hypothetical protein
MNVSHISSGSRSKPRKKPAAYHLFIAHFLLGLFFNPEDRGYMFIRTDFLPTIRLYNTEDGTLYDLFSRLKSNYRVRVKLCCCSFGPLSGNNMNWILPLVVVLFEITSRSHRDLLSCNQVLEWSKFRSHISNGANNQQILVLNWL